MNGAEFIEGIKTALVVEYRYEASLSGGVAIFRWSDDSEQARQEIKGESGSSSTEPSASSRKGKNGTASDQYVFPFNLVRGFFEIRAMDGDLSVSTNHAEFLNSMQLVILNLMQLVIGAVEVDSDWYMAENPDVAVACRAGQVASAQEHFTQNGYFEGRLPFKITVDEDWYLKAYPDVANGIAAGAFASAQEHFVAIGYLEGRLPRPNVGWLTTAQISNLLQAADLSARMRQNRPAVRSGRTDPGHLLRLAGLVSDLPGLSAGSSGMIQEVFKADFGTESRPEPQKRELSLQRRKRNGGFKPD